MNKTLFFVFKVSRHSSGNILTCAIYSMSILHVLTGTPVCTVLVLSSQHTAPLGLVMFQRHYGHVWAAATLIGQCSPPGQKERCSCWQKHRKGPQCRASRKAHMGGEAPPLAFRSHPNSSAPSSFSPRRRSEYVHHHPMAASFISDANYCKWLPHDATSHLLRHPLFPFL